MDTTEKIELPYDKEITVASNELFLRATINRNLEKLLKNDLFLHSLIENYGVDDEYAIQLYKDTREYSIGEAVIYPEYNEDKTEILNVYLLESVIDNNSNEPKYEIVDQYVRDFGKSGWKESNPFYSIYNSNIPEHGLSSFLENSISGKFHLSHENNVEYHKFGELSEDNLSVKILKTDFSNISDYRSNGFWPFETGKVKADNCIGTYKKWGNGLLEYDLTFCLGDTVHQEQKISKDGIVETLDYIKANGFVPLSSEDFNNDDYFLDPDSYMIFNKSGSQERFLVNGIAQTNILSTVNCYDGTIKFPIPFKNEQYMIFTCSTNADSEGHSQSPNTLAFLNRKKDSITAMLAIPNYNGAKNIEDVLLRKNVFQCQIIGRWN